MASAPSSCAMRALAASQAFGSTRMRPGACSARNWASLSLCVLMDASLPWLHALGRIEPAPDTVNRAGRAAAMQRELRYSDGRDHRRRAFEFSARADPPAQECG